MINQDECINLTGLNPVSETPDKFCKLKDGIFECDFMGQENECPDFKPFRAVMREIKNPSKTMGVK